jgi:hypothetical protein
MKRPTGRPSQQKEIMNWLEEYVNSGPGGMRSATAVEIAGAQRNHNLKALKRAKKKLGFVSIRVGGLGSEGDWMWANPRRLSTDKSITQELAEKLGEREKRIAGAAVTSKAQSRARIANGWLEQITEELFEHGKTLAEIREQAAKQDPYLTVKDFADLEEEFQLTATGQLRNLEAAKLKAEKTCQDDCKALQDAFIAGKVKSAEAEAEIAKAETVRTKEVQLIEQKTATIAKQVGPTTFHRLTAMGPVA